jgi:Fe2+ or Zn2+ uptake regulation protein
VEAVERSVGKQFKFATTSHSFQIYGICHSCQMKRKDEPSAH